MDTTKKPDNDTIAVARWSPVSPEVADFNFVGWQVAEPIHLHRYWSGAPAPSSRHAEARILWSEKGLHILFDCKQLEPLAINEDPQVSQKTMGLWDRDVCEIFVAPDTAAPNNYFEFEAAPTGEWLDVAIRSTEQHRESNWEFQSGFSVAAKTIGASILISVRIPWTKQLPEPSSGTNWRANFFRCIGWGDERGYLAWQPTMTIEPNFHVPSRFGWLRFVD